MSERQNKRHGRQKALKAMELSPEYMARLVAAVRAQEESGEPEQRGYLVPPEFAARILEIADYKAGLYVQEHGRGLLQ
jgi:hypothetical protein